MPWYCKNWSQQATVNVDYPHLVSILSKGRILRSCILNVLGAVAISQEIKPIFCQFNQVVL